MSVFFRHANSVWYKRSRRASQSDLYNGPDFPYRKPHFHLYSATFLHQEQKCRLYAVKKISKVEQGLCRQQLSLKYQSVFVYQEIQQRSNKHVSEIHSTERNCKDPQICAPRNAKLPVLR